MQGTFDLINFYLVTVISTFNTARYVCVFVVVVAFVFFVIFLLEAAFFVHGKSFYSSTSLS